jgi:PTH2 family peptidyl-tRNA hydrolase
MRRLLRSLAVFTGPEVRIMVNTNLSKGKGAAAAVHAALAAAGVPHGRVVVLHGTATRIERECEADSIIRDAGRTEVDPGTITAGVLGPWEG